MIESDDTDLGPSQPATTGWTGPTGSSSQQGPGKPGSTRDTPWFDRSGCHGSCDEPLHPPTREDRPIMTTPTIIHHDDDGPSDAPVLVLLPSLGSDTSMWAPQVVDLALDHRVLAVDTRGHGRSPAPAGPYTLADLGGDVIGLLDRLDVGKAHICGISMGGQTALWLAIHHPDRVRTLTAANTAPKVGSAEGWQGRIDAVAEFGLAGIRDDVLTRFFADGFAERNPEWFAEAQAAFTRADDDGYAACCAALAAADLRQDVGRITAPTLVIGGTDDVSTPPLQAEWLHDHIPCSHLEIIDGAAHLSNLDDPETFTRLLRNHIGG